MLHSLRSDHSRGQQPLSEEPTNAGKGEGNGHELHSMKFTTLVKYHVKRSKVGPRQNAAAPGSGARLGALQTWFPLPE